MKEVSIEIALKNYFEAVKSLRDQKLLINQKNFTCLVGERLVTKYSAASGLQVVFKRVGMSLQKRSTSRLKLTKINFLQLKASALENR